MTPSFLAKSELPATLEKGTLLAEQIVSPNVNGCRGQREQGCRSQAGISCGNDAGPWPAQTLK